MRVGTGALKTERQWRANTGLKEEQYFNLLEKFRKSYKELYGKELASRLQETGISYCIKDENDLLLFTLFSLKSGTTYDILGFIFGMDASNAKRQQLKGLEILNHTLKNEGVMPLSEDSSREEIEKFLSKCKNLTIDVTENRIQRPQNKEVQKEYFSGKKKPTQSNI
jgi:hypothetical protein